jgi:hypothetical protein
VIRFTIGWVVDEQVAHQRGAYRPTETGKLGFEFGLRTLIQGVCAASVGGVGQPAGEVGTRQW